MTGIPNTCRTFLAAAALLALAVPVAHAQTPAPKGATQGKGAESAAQPVELSGMPTDLDTLGVRLYLPLNAAAQTTILPGGKTKTVVTPTDESWVIQVFSSISGNKALTSEEALTAVVEQRKRQLELAPAGNRPSESLVREVDRLTTLELGGNPSARSYVYLLAPSERAVPVTGYTIINPGPGRFLIMQLDCSSDVFDRARVVYETVCAAAEFPAAEDLDTKRSAAIMAGREFLSTITSEDLDRALEPKPQYIRIFVPSPTKSPGDAREVGYQKIEIRKGQLGELDPSRERSSWSVSERETGYLVRVDARMLQDQWVFDSRAIFFLSLDRQRESWAILVEQKTGASVSKSTQTLVRSATRLEVRTERPGLPPEAKGYDLPEDQYISAVERYMLPRIVAHKIEPPLPAYLDLAFYCFDTTRAVVTLRREIFDRAEAGHWVCETMPGEGQPTWTSNYTSDGAMMSRLIPPLQVMEPSTAERIRALWKDKQLPIDKSP